VNTENDRFERDLQAEVDRFWPGEELDRVVGVRFTVQGGQILHLKDITFSNSITVEHPPTSRFRRTGNLAAVAMDWPARRSLGEGGFHYDQVDSVLSRSDEDGDLVATHYQDAFGVRQADFDTP
jgi:hypothetical protein